VKQLFSFFVFVFLLIACKQKVEDCKSCELDQNNVDSIVEIDKSSLDKALKSTTIESKSKEQVENLKKIEEKFGEQWDFCTCVKANDSINKAFEKNVSDKQADQLMARWEYVELKCKEFLTQPNTTPEEREVHEKKVKRCLRKK
jgi:hypothetical protein